MINDESFLKKLTEIFKVEAAEHLKIISDNTIIIEKDETNPDYDSIIEIILRSFHSLKGSAHSVGFTEIISICQVLESIFILIRKYKIKVDSEIFSLIYESLDIMDSILKSNQKKSSVLKLVNKATEIYDDLEFSLSIDSNDNLNNTKDINSSEIIDNDTSDTLRDDNIENNNIKITKSPDSLESIRVSVNKLNGILTQAEEMINFKLISQQQDKTLNELYKMIKVYESQNNKIYSDIKKIVKNIKDKETSEKILNLVFNDNQDQKLINNKFYGLLKNNEQFTKNLNQSVNTLIDSVKKSLLMPFSTILDSLPRIIRDISKQQSKDVNFNIKGESLEIDKRILEELKDAFIHLIRNNVDHGIETPDERIKKGKNPKANINISISQVNTNKIEIEIYDDGRGIDTLKLFDKALKIGLVSEKELKNYTKNDLLNLVFHSGLSTSTIITEISGRGLGLAIVKEKIERLGGSIVIDSQENKYTIFKIFLPILLSTFRSVITEISDKYFAIPLFYIETTMRINKNIIENIENKKVIIINDEVITFFDLSEILNIEVSDKKESNFVQVIIVKNIDKKIAFKVNNIISENELIVKNLGKQLKKVKNISGVTILGDGKLIPVLNMTEIIETTALFRSKINKVENKQSEPEQQSKILVVDDSITSRTLLKNILEASGYNVNVSINGFEAYSELMENKYDLVISDVEMPRINGFELTSKIRSTEQIADIPVILVTSLDKKEHKEMGIDVGANAYIVKTDFDQNNLLNIIPRLI